METPSGWLPVYMGNIERDTARDQPGGARELAGGRYRILETLGHGGAAEVYRAFDLARDQFVALKQLSMPEGGARRAKMLALFEIEYRTLAELSHPNIVTVYDYGVQGATAFYTMELVDGVDLGQRVRWPWREICSLLAEICSALSLVHSRGMVHRDISARNIRCRPDGRATLIDFGALAQIGPASTIAGSPAFIAPEALNKSQLDARTDLFSLGGTLYFALTGRLAFPAHELSQLREVWQLQPDPPSRFVEDIPDGLDALVMSLLSLEPASRPRTAAEVMQRLTAMLGRTRVESPDVSKAYLASPVIVGREPELAALRAQMKSALVGRRQNIMISGVHGVGRSRLLDTCVLELKTEGATVLRGDTRAGACSVFEIARSLVTQLFELLGDAALVAADAPQVARLFEPADAAHADHATRSWRRLDQGDAHANMTALAALIEHVAERYPIAIVVDDIERIDVQSCQVLVTLAASTRPAKLVLLSSVEANALAAATDGSLRSLAALCIVHSLAPLDRPDMLELFRLVFGDVPNLVLVAERLHAIAGGNPRVAMTVAQYLVDMHEIDFSAGVWRLPESAASLSLPDSLEEAISMQLGALSPLAQQLVEAQALASHEAFTIDEYTRVAGTAAPEEVERAVRELIQRRVLERKAELHTFSHRGWPEAAISRCDEQTLRERHRAIARLYDQHLGVEPVHHLLSAGLVEEALDRVLVRLRATTGQELQNQSRMTGAHLTSIIERALSAAIALDRPAREITDLRRWIAAFTAVITEEEAFYRVAPAWLEQLKHDSGLSLWQAEVLLDKNARIQDAMRRAAERYAATPERDRVYRVDEALRTLVHYVTFSIAIAARTQDLDLIASLPALLEPFAPLSRVVDVIRQNSMAGYELRVLCRTERARAIWLEVYERLGTIDIAELPNVQIIRNAVAAGIASAEVTMGLQSGAARSKELEKDPYQRVNALQMQRVVCLQHGDWEGAEVLRKQAEEQSAVSLGRQMFFNSTLSELDAHARAGDLLGIRQIIDRIEPLALRFPGWVPWRELAHAEHHRNRGDIELARRAFESLLGIDSAESAWEPPTRGSYWLLAVSGYLETLIALDEPERARSIARVALTACEERGIHLLARGIIRGLALAEAKLQDYEVAAERVERVIAEQRRVGVTGLYLGASYETRTRIAIWAKDHAAIETYARLTAREYRHGLNSPLGARYERLMDEARRVAAKQLPTLADVSNREPASTSFAVASTLVAEIVAGSMTRQERAQRLLAEVCVRQSATTGYLFEPSADGLQLLASIEERRPSTALVTFASTYLARETDSDETTIADTVMADDPTDMLSWTDSDGIAHHPVVLLDDNKAPKGVVVLSGCPTPSAQLRVFATLLARAL